jgi:enoyl-CoA hydratase/carnithine racemase
MINCRVGVVTLNRPKALNALCAGLMDELIKGKALISSLYELAILLDTGNPTS